MMRLYIFKKVLVIGGIITLGWIGLVSASPSDDLIPFTVGKAGARASIKVHVSWWTRNYPREVALMISYPKGENALQKFNLLMESMTGLIAFPTPGDNAIPKPHAGVPLRVTWVEKETGRELKTLDVVADNYQGRVRVGPGLAFSLDGMLLPPGNYVVTVTSMSDDSRFDGVQAGLYAGYTWK